MADPTTLSLLLGRLSRLNEANVTEVCTDHGTTPAELRVMALLAHRDDGQASPSEIAHFVVQTSGGLTATLRRLEADGMIDRFADPTDGRGRLVALTDRGRVFHARVIGAVVSRLERAIDSIDLGLAEDVVRSLVVALEADSGLPSSAGFVSGISADSRSNAKVN